MKRALAYVTGVMSASRKNARSTAAAVSPTSAPPAPAVGVGGGGRARPAIARVSPPPLSPLEARILGVLLSVARERAPGLTLRVAGGWVRDKMLLLEEVGRLAPVEEEAPPLVVEDNFSVDIDVALDVMMGEQFAALVNEWLVSQGEKPVSGGVIPSNPDQSKHLATARMRLMGVWVDLVNLRTETYANNVNSRIPDVDIGTPLEDAMRRDLTINALFYNVNTREVEDYTGRGVQDLRARVVRTPLPPLTTLLDDPLRALRAIRFASRFNFNFDRALYKACQAPDVHAALGAKVSRERVTSEVDQILSSKAPIHAIGLLVELGLFPVVFRLPEAAEDYVDGAEPPTDFPAAALGCLINLKRLCEHRRQTSIGFDYGRLARYSALMVPAANVQVLFVEPTTKKRKAKPVSLAHFIMRSELRMSSKDVSDIDRVLSASMEFTRLVHMYRPVRVGSSSYRDDCTWVPPQLESCSGRSVVKALITEATLDRLTVGRVLRATGQIWRIALQTALIRELCPAVAASTYASGMTLERVPLTKESHAVVEAYASFQASAEALGLEGVWDMKPAVDGRELTKLLPKLPRGPMIGKLITAQVEYQIEHPEANAEDVRSWLLKMYEEFR